MSDLATVTSYSRGARFYRADLHIHSFAVKSGSHDVKDTTMTPEAIVETAIAEELDIISITDHNEIGNVEAAIQAAGTDLLVVPGIELSTSQGHILCYLPDVEALRGFYSRLKIVDRGTSNSRCQQGFLECLSAVREFRGFGVLAHIDAPKGYEVEVPGHAPHKLDVLCHPGLLGIELRSAASDIAYSDQDPVPERAAIGRERITRLGLGAKQFLARVLFSDAHTLSALGRNAQGDKKVTRIKMNAPSFDALRVAFDDADARIRIEERIPYSVPFVLGVYMDGGFLDGQAIHFSRNLNCIIGGRGTGKSTTFEAVRCLSGEQSKGEQSKNDVIDSEVWPAGLHLFWQDAAGQQHSLFRASQNQVYNLDDPDFGLTEFSIDCYGQGETAKISQQAHSNPYVLIQYLDKFVDKEVASADEERAKASLLEIQGQIEKAESKVVQIAQYEKALRTTKQQLATLEKANAKEVIGLQRKLAQEKQVRVQIDRTVTDLKTKTSQFTTRGAITGLRQLAAPAELRVGQSEFQTILQLAAALDSSAQAVETKLRSSVAEFGDKVLLQLKTWRSKDAEAQQTIEAKKKELEAQGICLDMASIQKLAQDEALYTKELAELKALKSGLIELKRQRFARLRDRWAARDKIATIRDAYARKASSALLESLHDIKVSLKYIRNAYAPEAARQIQDVMGWRTVRYNELKFSWKMLPCRGCLTLLRRMTLALLRL